MRLPWVSPTAKFTTSLRDEKKDVPRVKFKWMPVVDVETCTGCGKCVEACGPRCLTIDDQLAVLSEPERCGSEEHCIEPCPENAIHMAWRPWSGNEERGVWRAADLLTQT